MRFMETRRCFCPCNLSSANHHGGWVSTRTPASPRTDRWPLRGRGERDHVAGPLKNQSPEIIATQMAGWVKSRYPLCFGVEGGFFGWGSHWCWKPLCWFLQWKLMSIVSQRHRVTPVATQLEGHGNSLMGNRGKQSRQRFNGTADSCVLVVFHVPGHWSHWAVAPAGPRPVLTFEWPLQRSRVFPTMAAFWLKILYNWT